MPSANSCQVCLVAFLFFRCSEADSKRTHSMIFPGRLSLWAFLICLVGTTISHPNSCCSNCLLFTVSQMPIVQLFVTMTVSWLVRFNQTVLSLQHKYKSYKHVARTLKSEKANVKPHHLSDAKTYLETEKKRFLLVEKGFHGLEVSKRHSHSYCSKKISQSFISMAWNLPIHRAAGAEK